MRYLFLLVLILPSAASAEEVRSAEECEAAIITDAAAAREAAARWILAEPTFDARMCEATALRATGAVGTAALRLTEMGEDLGLSMSQVVRAEVFAEAGALWLTLGEPHFAHTAFLNAQRLDAASVQPTLLARAKAALGQFSDARALLNRHLTTVPDDQEARFLRAQILRELDAFDEAAQDLAALGDAPQVQIERALLAADQGDLPTASDLLLDVIAAYPDSPAAQDARAEFQRLAQ